MEKSNDIIDFKAYLGYLRRVTGAPNDSELLTKSISDRYERAARIRMTCQSQKRCLYLALSVIIMLLGTGCMLSRLAYMQTDCHGALVSLTSQEEDVQFHPIETFDKKFRWFYTDYDCQVCFASLQDNMPLPLERYMTSEQAELYFRGHNIPAGRNGKELFDMLKGLDANFISWYSDAVYFKMCDIIEPYCTPEQVEVLSICKDDFLSGGYMEMLLDMKPQEFEAHLADLAPEAGFGDIYTLNADEIDDRYETESDILRCFDNSFVYILHVPGKYLCGNADEFIDEKPAWRVDAIRLLGGDLVAESHHRHINLWAFFITLLAGGLLSLALFRLIRCFNKLKSVSSTR